jgi:hypothetical protein
MPLRCIPAFLFSIVIASTAVAQTRPAAAGQAATPTVAGVWVLNPALTVKPDEIGFSNDWARTADEGGRSGGSSGGGGGRGRRGGSGGGGAFGGPPVLRESADDSTRIQQLTGEARTPPAHITIVQKDNAVSIADDQGHSRTFHPDGRLEELTIGTVALPTRAQWDSGSLIVVFDVESGRQLRYTFTPTTNPTRLLVNIRFLERGRDGDEVKLTYETPDDHERALLAGTGAAPAAPPAGRLPPPDGAPPAGRLPPPDAAPPARPPVLPPGAELRGLTVVGTQVEDLSAQAIACGLDQGKIKTSVAKILADAGFKTQPYGNEESYVLVSVVTSRLSDGTCVSRWDASLVAQGDASFPYLKGLVAMEVPLLREGGLAGGSPAAHAASIMDSLAKAVSRFVSQVRAAAK